MGKGLCGTWLLSLVLLLLTPPTMPQSLCLFYTLFALLENSMKEGKDARSAISFPSRTQQLQTSIQLKYTAAANEIHYIFQNLSHRFSVILQEVCGPQNVCPS